MSRRELNVLTNATMSEEAECGTRASPPSARYLPLNLKDARSHRESDNGSDVDRFVSDLTPVLANGKSCRG